MNKETKAQEKEVRVRQPLTARRVGDLLLNNALIIIMIIAAFIQNFAHLPAVQNAFAGIRVCVCVLILNAVVKLWKKSVVDWKTFLIFLLVFAGSVFLNISPVLYVLAAAVAGVVIRELEARKA